MYSDEQLTNTHTYERLISSYKPQNHTHTHTHEHTHTHTFKHTATYVYKNTIITITDFDISFVYRKSLFRKLFRCDK